MPLFRLHRHTLEDSLETTVIVENIHHLRSEVVKEYILWQMNLKSYLQPDTLNRLNNFNIRIGTFYNQSVRETFDSRCGWYTHYVLADIIQPDEFVLIGFLSEPLLKDTV